VLGNQMCWSHGNLQNRSICGEKRQRVLQLPLWLSVPSHPILLLFSNPCMLEKPVTQVTQYFWNSEFLSVDFVPTNSSLSFPKQQCLKIGLNTGRLHYWSSTQQKCVQIRGKHVVGMRWSHPLCKFFIWFCSNKIVIWHISPGRHSNLIQKRLRHESQ
jgi:hypothetical protein